MGIFCITLAGLDFTRMGYYGYLRENEDMKVRRKPRVFDTIQFDGKNKFEICEFFKGYGAFNAEFFDDKIEIKTLEGVITASPGDWIIRGVKGEFYPCKPDIFWELHEAVEE